MHQISIVSSLDGGRHYLRRIMGYLGELVGNSLGRHRFLGFDQKEVLACGHRACRAHHGATPRHERRLLLAARHHQQQAPAVAHLDRRLKRSTTSAKGSAADAAEASGDTSAAVSSTGGGGGGVGADGGAGAAEPLLLALSSSCIGAAWVAWWFGDSFLRGCAGERAGEGAPSATDSAASLCTSSDSRGCDVRRSTKADLADCSQRSLLEPGAGSSGLPVASLSSVNIVLVGAAAAEECSRVWAVFMSGIDTRRGITGGGCRGSSSVELCREPASRNSLILEMFDACGASRGEIGYAGGCASADEASLRGSCALGYITQSPSMNSAQLRERIRNTMAP